MAMKTGRRSPKNTPALRFASFRATTGAVPAHPATVDYLATLTDWQMLGNDRVGDCNSVTWANMRRLVTATLSTESYPTQEMVWKFYKTQNPKFNPNGDPNVDGPSSQYDQGMEIQTGLEYLHSNGGPDGVKAVAFAKVDHTNIEEVRAAIALFGGLWLGITVLDENQQQFADGREWTNVSNGTVDGGHAILAGGYTPDVRFITWGQEAGFAPSFWNGTAQGYQLVEEAWVVIWPEHLQSKEFLAGVDVNALAADYAALTGKTLPLPTPRPKPGPTPDPTPVPVPVPNPAPVPTPVPTDLADIQLAIVAKSWSRQTHWFKGNKRMAAALQTWLAAKGLGS